jgi:glycosyltransferase involved in cell wall biosynthesis
VSVFDREATGGLFESIEIEASPANRFPLVRRSRLALFLAMPFVISLTRPFRSTVLLCSSSGWAHGLRARGAKVVYCYNPARWLYQETDYFRGRPSWVLRLFRLALTPMRWLDRRWATSATLYIGISRTVADRIQRTYGISARVIHPPLSFRVRERSDGQARAENTYMTVARARSYKGVDIVVDAFRQMPSSHLVIVGEHAGELPPNVEAQTNISDEQLAALYLSSAGLIAVSQEDFGLTPVEAHAHGCPVLALRSGGYLDTIVEGTNGVFIDSATPDSIIRGLQALSEHPWDEEKIKSTSLRFSEERFLAELDAALADAEAIYLARRDPEVWPAT